MPGVQGLVNSWVNLRKDSIVFHESSISTRKTSSSTAKDSSVSRSTTTTRNNNKSIKRKKSSSSSKKPFPTFISDESTIATARTASTVITTSTGRSHGSALSSKCSSNSRSSNNKSYSMSPLAPPCTQLPNMMMMPPPAMANEVVNVNTSATAGALKNTNHASMSSSSRADYVPRSQRNEINYQDTAPRNSYIPLQELQFTKRISEECYVGFYQSKSVLVKVLSQNINCTPKKWSQTISKLVSLNHPGLSQLYGWSEINPFSEEDKSYCLVQEYCESSQKTLESVLNEKGSSSSRSSHFKWKIIEEVANALEYLHSYNFVFGYLHPSKIILSDEGSSDGLPRGVKLMDYGYAYLLNRSLNNSVYRAPELLRGAPVSTAGDMYAFMTIAHELFTGLHPSRFLMGRTNKLPKQLMGFIHVSRSQDPNERPTLSTVLQILPELKRSCCGGSSSSVDNLNKSNHSLVSSSTNSMVSSSEAANKSSLNVKSNNKQRGGFPVFGPSTGKRRSLFALRDKSSKSASASLKSSVSSEYIDNKNDSSIYSGKTSTTSVRGPPKKAAKKNLSIFSKKFFKNSSKRNKEIEESSSSIMDDGDSHQDILSSNDNRSHTSEQKSDQDIEEVLLEQQGQGSSTSSIKTQTEFVGAPPPPLTALAGPLVQPILPRTLLHVSKPQDKVNEEALIEETSSLTLPEVSKNTIQPISQPGIPFVHIVHDGEDHFKSFIERNTGSSISNSSLTAFNMDKLNEYGELAQHNPNNETQTVSSSSNYTQSNHRQIKRTYSCPSLDTSVYSQLSSTNKLPSPPRRSHSTQPPSLPMQQQLYHHHRVNSVDNNMAFSSSSSVMPIKPMAHRGLMISLPSQLEPHQQAKPLSLPSTIMEDEPMNLSSNDSHNNTLMNIPDPVPSSTTNNSSPSINDDESMASASTATTSANEEDVEIAASILTSQFRSP